jgi:hypothetical protein
MIPVICCQLAAQAVGDVPHVLLIEIVVFALRMLKMSRSGVIRVVGREHLREPQVHLRLGTAK